MFTVQVNDDVRSANPTSSRVTVLRSIGKENKTIHKHCDVSVLLSMFGV